MELEVQRVWYTDTSTCGGMELHGKFLAYTLERQIFKPGMQKPYAIPAGRYALKLLMSLHFGKVVPHVMGVPGFDAIEIHVGNWPSDVRGCTALGMEHREGVTDPHSGLVGGAVYGSEVAFDALMAVLLAATEDVFITFSDTKENQ